VSAYLSLSLSVCLSVPRQSRDGSGDIIVANSSSPFFIISFFLPLALPFSSPPFLSFFVLLLFLPFHYSRLLKSS